MAAAKTAKKNEKGIPYGAREHMPLWFPLAWSSRGVANAINVILVGYVTYYCTDMLGLAGYDGSLEVQSAGAMNAIVGLYNYLPLAMCILMLVLSLMYQVDKIRPQMEADLKARHEH